MALGTADEWQKDVDVNDSMIVKLKNETPPELLTDCQRNAEWWEIFCLWGAKNQMDENIDFVNWIDDYRRTSDGNKADRIYQEFLAPGAPRPANVSDYIAKGVLDVYAEDPPLRSLDMFDATYDEVMGVLDGNYRRFRLDASATQRELQAAGASGGEITRDTIDMTVVDKTNEEALKVMDEGYSTNFWQIDDLVIIAHQDMRQDEQPYLEWIRDQVEVAGRRAGMLTMTEKGAKTTGKLFGGPGTITVSGADDQDLFKKAIRRVSKKKIVFE
jgi:hypothetical protein